MKGNSIMIFFFRYNQIDIYFVQFLLKLMLNEKISLDFKYVQVFKLFRTINKYFE